MTRVTAPSRLHFGLLNLPVEGRDHWPGLDAKPGLPVRQFGGVGLMVDEPGVIVCVKRANKWSAVGPLAGRALEFASQLALSLPSKEQRPFRIVVESCANEHAGLGTGTQLALAVAKAMAIEAGFGDWPATALAKRIGRGERSAIGVHGFDRGGLIVEAGKLPGEAISPLIAHHHLPADWAVLLFSPEDPGTWYGSREREAFARLGQAGPSPAETETLARIVLTGVLPAVASADLDAFGEAIYEFNARVGDAFATVQGRRYASPAVADCVRRLRLLGVRGVGQSSWGPTVFAVVPKGEEGRVLRSIKGVSGIATRPSPGRPRPH